MEKRKEEDRRKKTVGTNNFKRYGKKIRSDLFSYFGSENVAVTGHSERFIFSMRGRRG